MPRAGSLCGRRRLMEMRRRPERPIRVAAPQFRDHVDVDEVAQSTTSRVALVSRERSMSSVS
jgi:hypothetical protein